MSHPDPMAVERLAFTLWRVDLMRSGLAADETPAWAELEAATRRHYRVEAELRLMAEPGGWHPAA